VGGPQVQMIELADGEDGQLLQFRHSLLQYFEPEFLFDRDPVILLEDIESAQFEFMGLDEEGALTDWMANWDQPYELPVAVRLSVAFTEGQNMQWPDLVAGVRIDRDALQTGAGNPSMYQQKIGELLRRRGSIR
jgi:hypothetical protein